VTAAPVDAAANEALIKLLAEYFDWPRSSVEWFVATRPDTSLSACVGFPPTKSSLFGFGEELNE